MAIPNLDRGHATDEGRDRAHALSQCNRRQFWRYFVGGTTGTLAIGWLFPNRSVSLEATQEELCSAFPLNSRCQDYLPGAIARDAQGQVVTLPTLLKAKLDEPLPVKVGAETDITYLVITQKPTTTLYAIKPICTHLGCTVNWQPEKQRFICPCHGSQYDAVGRVVQGPARRALPLKTTIVKQEQVRIVERSPAIDPR